MDQIKQLLLSLTLKQRISIGVAALAVIGGIFWLSRWNRERDFKPLYSGLSQEDAAAVVAKVREGGTEFRLAENGSTVMIPSTKVMEMRLQLAAAGVPKSGRIGFELFDKVNFGTSDFTEQINFHRAVEGELERTMMAIAEVELARVHVTFPKDSVYTEQKLPAKASVLLKLKTGAKLSKQNVAAICQLVASAVEGLTPEAVSLVDMQGNLLTGKTPESPEELDPDQGRLNLKAKIEKDLKAKIDGELEPLLGPDRFRSGVSVEFDYNSGEQSEEVYDPAKSVIVSSQKTEDIGGSSQISGQPGTAPNLPRPPARPVGGNSTIARRSETMAYQSSRVVRKLKLPQGTIKRLSVSVLLDNMVRREGTGAKAKRIVEPPSPERLKAIRDVVAGASGFSAERGDQLFVESLAFESTLNYEPPGQNPAPEKPSSWLENAMKNKMFVIGAGVAVLVLVLLVVAGIYFMKKRQAKAADKPVAEPVEVAKELEPAESKEEIEAKELEEVGKSIEAQIAENQAAKERQEAEALNALKLPVVQTKRAEVLAKHINEEAKKDPKMLAHIVRAWLHENNRQ
jgi:flagellar M-ring protein FliF